MIHLRDFLYLDNVKLHSFVSQIQGGMISEINETIKQSNGLSAGINVGIPQLGGKIDAGKQKDNERQQNIYLTDPAYFSALYNFLNQEKSLLDITDLSPDKIFELPIGQFIEMRGLAEPPVVENWIERLNSIFSFIERNLQTFNKLQGNPKGKSSTNFSNMDLRHFRSIIDLLIDYINITRKDPGKTYVGVSPANQVLKAWCGLLPNSTLVPLDSILPTEVTLFGRIDHFVKENEPEKIVDLTLFNQSSQVDSLLDGLNGFNNAIRQKPIYESDLESKFPDIFVTPVAIYK